MLPSTSRIRRVLTLFTTVEKAANEWLTKLGKGEDNGHRFVGFRHWRDPESKANLRCVDNGAWNELVPEGMLMIQKSFEGFSSSTIGFIPETE